MIKLFEQHSKEQDLHTLCEEYDIKYYSINDDYTIDVDGNVDIGHKHIRGVLPIKFNRVEGHFNCEENNLTSLLGCPNYVGGAFNCCNNDLKTLEHSPNYVGEDFYCVGNYISSLKGITEHINGGLYCQDNDLETLEYSPKYLRGDINCNLNKLTSLKGSPYKIYGNFICSNNDLTTLEYLPNDIEGLLAFNGNRITSLKGLSNNFKDITYGDNPLPGSIIHLSHDETLILIKYQEEYGIWNSDGTLNMPRFGMFITDMKIGTFYN